MPPVLSRYLKIYPAPGKPGSYILYSTRKGSLVRVSAALLACAQQGTLGAGDQAALRRMEILIDDPAAERADMESLVARSNSRSRKFKATVVLNLDCNLACPYCYEDFYRGKKYLGRPVGRQIVDHVIGERIDRGRDVKIGFYGGEPRRSMRTWRRSYSRICSTAEAATVRLRGEPGLCLPAFIRLIRSEKTRQYPDRLRSS